jgi:large subunit ribosomal protein L4e
MRLVSRPSTKPCQEERGILSGVSRPSVKMAARPLVNVQSVAGEAAGQVQLPAVFSAPLRADIVQTVHTHLNKNHRQPYAPATNAGHQTAAESWGTGRAVSRIPRVPGGGTHRAGQAAFGNMCRGGHMFAPNHVWRRWHRRVNVNLKRYATCSALAATALPSLVMARGHKVDGVAEVPLVLDDEVAAITKTKQAVEVLKKVQAPPRLLCAAMLEVYMPDCQPLR